MSKVYLLIGLPGSGKSSWASRREAEPGVVVCSADYFFTDAEGNYAFDVAKLPEAHGQCLRKFVSAVNNGAPCVIVDNTNCSAVQAAPYIEYARAFGCPVDVMLFRTTIENSVARNIHGVPRPVVEHLAASMEKMLEEWPPWWPKPQLT